MHIVKLEIHEAEHMRFVNTARLETSTSQHCFGSVVLLRLNVVKVRSQFTSSSPEAKRL